MLAFLNKYILGPVLPVTVFAAGIYFIVRLRGFPFTQIRLVAGLIASRDEKDGVSPFSALCLSLAGTLGVGNIVGVASAIALGGSGAVFWMLLSALAAMTLKYAEVALSMLTRKSDGVETHGGPMFYIKNAVFAKTFAALIAVTALALGSLIQIRAAADCAVYCFDIPPLIIGVIFGILCVLIVGGGLTRLSAFTVKLIPALSLCYIILTLSIIILRITALPAVVTDILKNAFKTDSAFGGIIGFLLSSSIRAGVSRGILSNEAGLGTSPIAHAHSSSSDPVRQGGMGIFEVFADTILLCGLTAFAILSSGVKDSCDGAMLYVLKAFGSVIKFAPPILAVSIILFAFATVIAWAHYGLEALHYLTTSRTARILYTIFYSILTVFGAIIPAEFSWELTEALIGILTIVNTAAVTSRSDEIAAVTFKAVKFNRFYRRSPIRSFTRRKSSGASAEDASASG